jgi:CRP-like cAMP-binding protein
MRERTDPTKLAMLRRIPALRSASDADLEGVAAAVDVLDVAAGQRLTVEGRPGRSVYLVVEGRAVAERAGSADVAIGAGDVVADLTPVAGAVRGAGVRAVTPMRLLVAGPGTINDLLDGFEAAAEAVGAVAASTTVRRPGLVRRALGLAAAPT